MSVDKYCRLMCKCFIIIIIIKIIKSWDLPFLSCQQGACDGAEETETCANLSGEEECLWNVWRRAVNETSYISSVIQNEQRTFTLPKNIITDFSLARVLYAIYTVWWINLLPLIYTARVCGALQLHGHRSWSAALWQVSEAALRAASLKIGLNKIIE